MCSKLGLKFVWLWKIIAVQASYFVNGAENFKIGLSLC